MIKISIRELLQLLLWFAIGSIGGSIFGSWLLNVPLSIVMINTSTTIGVVCLFTISVIFFGIEDGEVHSQ